MRVSAYGAKIIRLLRRFLGVHASFIMCPNVKGRATLMSSLRCTSARVSIFTGARVKRASWYLVGLPTSARIRASQVRFVRFLFTSTSTSHNRREDRKMVGNFLCVNREAVYPIQPSGNVNQNNLRFFLCYVRVSFKRSAIQVRCSRVFTITAFNAMVANLSKAKIQFIMMVCVRLSLMLIRCLFTESE